MNKDGAPNARIEKTGNYVSGAGGALKIRYLATRSEKGWINFSPASLKVEFNGAPVEFCQRIEIVIDATDAPQCKLTFALDDVDIDMDTLIWLKAHLTEKEKAAVDAKD